MFLRNIRLQPFTGEFCIAKSCWRFVILASYWLAVRCFQAEHRCRIKVSRYEALPCFVDSRVICFGWKEDGLTACKLNGQPRLPPVWNTQLYWTIWKLFSCVFSVMGEELPFTASHQAHLLGKFLTGFLFSSCGVVLTVCPGDAKLPLGSRRHVSRECWSCRREAPSAKPERSKEKKGKQTASIERSGCQKVLRRCLWRHTPQRNLTRAHLRACETVSSGFLSMHSSNPKVRNSPSGNTQR